LDNWKVSELDKINNRKEDVDIYLPYEEIEDDNSWIIDLARVEDNIEQTGEINFDSTIPAEKILKDSTLKYLKYLRSHITKLITIFNSNKSVNTSSIKVYGISNTEADFMVFRNSLKLIFSMQRPGIIQISYNVSTGGFFTNSTISTAEQRGDLIHAQLGPFNETIWMYQGKKINTKEMIRFFISRFVQNSVR
jgi:hypothetical protein